MDSILNQISTAACDGNYSSMVEKIRYYIWESEEVEEAGEEEKTMIMSWLSLAVDAEDDVAMNIIGAMYAEGRLVDQDLTKAYEWYKKAAEKGNRLATSNLGFCYLYGRGTKVDYEKAYYAFLDAAVLGEGDAIVRLGDMFFFGDYVKQDKERAVRYYKHAVDYSKCCLPDLWAEQVYTDAARRLGDCCLNGEGMEKDIKQAVLYYNAAVLYYKHREEQGDSYYESGLKKAKEGLAKATELLLSEKSS